MLVSILLLGAFIFLAWKASPREKAEDAHVHGAGQIGLLAAVALFGVDYFTSYYYATGEMMSALHPYGLQQNAYIGAGIIAFANMTFGALYMFSLGPFNEGGGSYTASMRYLRPTLSLIVAVTLIQDYILTIAVSALSGGDQLLSILNAYDAPWVWHFALGAVLAAVTWYLTIRGRGESAQVVFIMIGIFGLMSVTMLGGLILAAARGVPPIPPAGTPEAPPSLGQAMLHMLTASMKGMVALTGLEAVSNGIQFFKDEDAAIVKWGKKRLPGLMGLWNFYSGKSGIGRFVQTSFLFYGGLTTLFLTIFSIRFDVFDGTLGRTLVGNLAYIGFDQIPGGIDDGLSGRAGDGVARRGYRRDPGDHHLPRPTRHVHPVGDGDLHPVGDHHAAGARPDDSGRAVLRSGRIHADHDDGAGGAPARAPTLRGTQADVGRGQRDGRGSVGRDRVLRPVDRQMGRGRLDRTGGLQPAGGGRAPDPDFAGRLPGASPDSPDRAREGPRARRDGFHRRMAGAQDAGVPLLAAPTGADRCRPVLRVVRRAPPGAVRAGPGGGRRLRSRTARGSPGSAVAAGTISGQAGAGTARAGSPGCAIGGGCGGVGGRTGGKKRSGIRQPGPGSNRGRDLGSGLSLTPLHPLRPSCHRSVGACPN